MLIPERGGEYRKENQVWQISIMIPPATHTEKDDVFFLQLLVNSGVVFFSIMSNGLSDGEIL